MNSSSPADDARIRRIHAELAAAGTPSLVQLVHALDGAYPSMLARRLDAMGLSYSLRSRGTLQVPGSYRVELHPLLFEWYFDQPTIEAIVGRIAPSDAVICLGTPTVAAALARRSQYVDLVDRNPLVEARFPELRDSRVRIARVEGLRTNSLSAPQWLVMDAPWYLRDMLRWLRAAHVVADTGSRILMSLFPRGTRPTAPEERQTILAYARRMGPIQVTQGALRYETPLFEREALRADGVELAGDWRLGDLVEIDVRRSISWLGEIRRSLARATPERLWSDFVLGSQLVKLGHRRTHVGRAILRSIPGCPGEVLPTVSARDSRRRFVGLWTSRNRVLSVSNPEVVRVVLNALSLGRSFDEAVERTRERHRLDDESVQLLRRALR